LAVIKEALDQESGPPESMVDQLFILRQLFQKTAEFDKEMHVHFIDLKKAYDSIYHKSLINILKEYNFPQKLVKLVETSIIETFVKTRVGEAETDPIIVKSGLRGTLCHMFYLIN